ncbi:hypothetical protein AURDEDRAFT_178351 [Auricularia subglabra TFB-10046 SS5]|uniref:Peptidase S54 rhomboid domain-containing protein n=1 Tax=Auricularia subglabra (strain TFB-10046 / SS5) TaxID=717982 RepID=J0D1U8_AURST|nr:hypothetical protein AURDEDRAFT_178351 [Auricularia subglabra TFB-10046 SS5]
MGHVMRRSFSHDPLSGRRYTLLTSTFSHQDFFHGALNGVAFASFALPVMALLDRDDLARGGPGRVLGTSMDDAIRRFPEQTIRADGHLAA